MAQKRELVLDIGLFEPGPGNSTRRSERALFWLLELIVALNVDMMRSGAQFPPLYAAGVRWEKEPPEREIFMTIPAILRDGAADCEDLAAARVSELRFAGEPASFVLHKWAFIGPDQMTRVDGRGSWQFSTLRSMGGPGALILYDHGWFRDKPPKKSDPGLQYHVLVERASGEIEDPSRILGMKGAA